MPSLDQFMMWLSAWQILEWAVKSFIVGTTLRPIPLPSNPMYLPYRDVSLVVPTIDFDLDLIISLRSWLINQPKEIIIVTNTEHLDRLVALLSHELTAAERKNIHALSYPIANKRRQMVTGIQKATGNIIVFSDDDVFWPPELLKYTLAAFESSPSVGAVGLWHRACRQNTPAAAFFNSWEALAARRLSLRKRDISASVLLDGGIPCISGRTAAYRATVVKNTNFQQRFTNEYWLGSYRLNSGDDQFMSRWIVDQGWTARIQSAPEAEIETTVLLSSMYLRQWLRWHRNAQRSYSKRYPFLAIKMAESLLMAFVRPVFVMWQLCVLVEALSGPQSSMSDFSILKTLLASSACIPAIVGHLGFAWEQPWFRKHMGAQIAMDMASPFLSFYCLVTLHKTGWGSRKA